MANINPYGVVDPTGRQKVLQAGDNLVNTSLGFLAITGIVGVTGVQGSTGLQNAGQGETGIGLFGHTGLAGSTGVSPEGDTGLSGITGLQGFTGISVVGVTGIQGGTGIQGITGLVGVQGFTGLAGYTGLAGDTGLTGVTGLAGSTGTLLAGFTGLRGETGVQGGDTGLQGVTGVGLRGFIGLQGVTGLVGSTGVFELATLSAQQQTSGVTLLYSIPANTLSSVGQQLTLMGWGLSATDGAATTITVTYAGNTIFTDSIASPGGSDILVEGYILLWGAASHDITVKGVYANNDGVTTYTPNILVSPSIIKNIYISLGSAGTGHVLYGLIVRNQQPGLNETI